MTSFLVKQKQCPECARRGKDTSKDNLGVFSDGHCYCFSCGYYKTDKIKSFKSTHVKEEPIVLLPIDCDLNYPKKCLDWVEKYHLTKIDLLNHNVLWSESEQRLIFPIYGDGNLIGWQGRSFKETAAIEKVPKWCGQGINYSVLNIIGKGNKVVLCEDVVSAIKISKAGFIGIPLYGSFVSKERFKRLYGLFKDSVVVYVWLDYDKASKSPYYSKLGRLFGLHCQSIITEKDPKEYTIDKIQEILK